MTKFRVVRSFSQNIKPSTEKAYKIESVGLMTQGEALQLINGEMECGNCGALYDLESLTEEIKAQND